MSAIDFIGPHINSSGGPIGIKIQGFTLIPFNQGGIVMHDSAGTPWLITMGTDGRLQTQQVSF